MTDLDIVFGGRVFCDLVMSGVSTPAPGAEVFADGFTLTPGGAATRAVAAARLGFGTALVGAVGADLFGRAVRDALAAEPALRLEWLTELTDAHTAVTVALTNSTDRSFVTYEERATWPPERLERALPPAGAAHVGLAEGVPVWVRDLRAAGTFVVAGIGWDETGRWSPDVLDRLELVDAFVPNEEEALNYTQTLDVDAALEALSARTPVVVVTRGGDGALAIDASSGERCAVPAPRVRALDPTGAGDCFVAAWCGARTTGWDLRTSVSFAVLAASESVQHLGGAASAPTAAALAARLRVLGDDLPPADWATVLGHLEGQASPHRRSGVGERA